MDDKKKIFVIPEAEIIDFSEEDIITASDGSEWFINAEDGTDWPL